MAICKGAAVLFETELMILCKSEMIGQCYEKEVKLVL